MEQNADYSITIVVPVFNAGEFLTATIESVLNQEYNNWELLLIDDGSNDNSSDIAKSFALQYPENIFYFEHNGHVNKGVTSTRNLGLSKASGNWIAFLDADDLWLPNKLKVQVELLKQNEEADAICEATKYWHHWNSSKSTYVNVAVGVTPEKLYYPPELTYKLYPLGPGTAPSMCGLIIKKSTLKKIGGFEESFTGKNQLFEDQAFLLKIYLSCKVFISSASNNIYRQRECSLMHSIKNEGYYLQGKLYFLEWLQNYIQQRNMNHPTINKLICKEIFLYKHPYIIKAIEKVKKKYKIWSNKKYV